jgi:hypothetical protein
MPTITPQPTFTSGNLINWDSYNKALTEIKLQDNYGTAFRILNEAEMYPEQVLQLPAPTGASAYGYKNYADGAIATWYSNYSSTVENVPEVATQINSNAAAGATNTWNWQFSANTDYSGGGSGGSTGSTFHGSDVTPTGGAQSGLSFVQNTITPAVAAAGLGIKLGKVIDSTLYNLNPDFWDNHGMSSLNPQTWDSITMDMSDSGWEGVLKRGFNAIFGLNSDTNKSQMYIDADAAAYLAMYMQEQGVFNPPEEQVTNYTDTDHPLTYPNRFNLPLSIGNAPATLTYQNGAYDTFTTPIPCKAVYGIQNSAPWAQPMFIGDSAFTMTRTASNGNVRTFNALRDNATNKYYTSNSGTISASDFASCTVPLNTFNGAPIASDVCKLLTYGNIQQGGGVDGITNQDGATQPNFSGCETPDDYKQALQQQYPDMFQNAITQNVAQPDGSVNQKTYIPVGTPTGTGNQTTTDPSVAGQSQGETAADPSTSPEALARSIMEILTRTYTPTDTPTDPTNPPDTGEGNTPTVVTPTGNASALWSVYNPTQAQLNSFGAWLWSSNFIDQVLKLFNNPMQSIIGVHKIFATPATSGTGNITVGYLSSGVSANLVSNQYTDINCGTVKVSEQFGNVFDYTDTQIRLYLPFIGIVDLDISDVMRGSVSVAYHVDVITGACLAEVKVTRDGSGGTLYQYAGDAAVRYPISSGSYMGVVAGIASAVGGVAGAVMTGGATLPMAAGAIAGGISGAHTQVQHSGNFSGNAGAMGGKKPYLIIERPQTMIADNFASYQGRGANVRRTVGQMGGYFKFSDVHTDSINGAAESEIEAIRAALESGVIA